MELVFNTLAGGSPAVVLAVRTGLSFIVLSARAVKVSQHTVAGCVVLAWVGLTKVRVPMALYLQRMNERAKE